MNNNKYYGDDDLVVNTTSRIPVCLCLDVSGSMYNCISELEEGVEKFYDAIRKSSQASNSCEIAIVTFESRVEILEDYTTIDAKQKLHLTASGGTDMTGGVLKSLELLNNRKDKYRANGVDYYQPWLVIMSDGEPNDRRSIVSVQETVKKMESEKKLTVFAIGIGPDVDMQVLNGFSKRGALHLKNYNFEEFFEWLGKSVDTVSQSQIGDKVKLDTTGMDEWASIDS